MNEDLGKEFYRTSSSVKWSGPFSEASDSEENVFLRSSPSQNSAPNLVCLSRIKELNLDCFIVNLNTFGELCLQHIPKHDLLTKLPVNHPCQQYETNPKVTKQDHNGSDGTVTVQIVVANLRSCFD